MKVKAFLSVFFLVAATFAFAGCAYWGNQRPGSGYGGLSFETLKRGKDYKILADTEGKSCGALLFGFLNIGGEAKNGAISGGGAAGGNPLAALLAKKNPVEAAAIYNAIETVPDADLFLPTRSNWDGTNYYIYNEVCYTVKGKAIRVIND